MNTVVDIIEPRLLKVQITDDEIIAILVDGRKISVPLVWSWRLSEASPEQRQNFEILGNDAKKKILFEERGEKCVQCGILEWCGEKLTLQLDHIDGNRENNIRENLRILCPNCHSLTSSYVGRNQIPHNKGKKYIKKETAGTYR